MLEVITTIFGGGLTGVIGNGLSQWFESRKREQDHRFELEKMREDREMTKLEIEGRERVAEVERETQADVSAAKAFASSFEADRATYSQGDHWFLAWVDAVRGLTRPVLTAFLVFNVSVLWFTADDPVLEQSIVQMTLYLAATAVTWWFGSRIKAKAPV